MALAGRQGWAAAGLAVLGRGFRSPRALVEAYQRPQPPYAAGPAAALAGATAMIDVSDGLVADLGHVAADSAVAIDLHSSSFELAEPMHAVGAALGVDPMQFVLGGGDDHALVATFPADADLPDGFSAIGSVLDVQEGPKGDRPRGHGRRCAVRRAPGVGALLRPRALTDPGSRTPPAPTGGVASGR